MTALDRMVGSVTAPASHPEERATTPPPSGLPTRITYFHRHHYRRSHLTTRITHVQPSTHTRVGTSSYISDTLDAFGAITPGGSGLANTSGVLSPSGPGSPLGERHARPGLFSASLSRAHSITDMTAIESGLLVARLHAHLRGRARQGLT